jgi:uncharacterized protein (DUF1800 family)
MTNETLGDGRCGVIDEELAHLLRRTEYVAKPDRMAALAGATRSAAVASVLAVSPTPVALPAFIDHDIDGQHYDQWVFAVQWWLDRMVDSPTPMQEKMTWFWHGHFCSSWEKVNSARLMMGQNKLFRDMAFGNFRTLAQAMSLQPAMLLYLDNVDNVKSSPNQNFARELMELFTLGVGNYSEDDVTAAARAWTGHGVDWNTYDYLFRANQHDVTMKTFMGVTRNWNGPDIIDFLLRENVTTKRVACTFLTRKLWSFFAGSTPSQATVDQLAQVLFAADMEILPWVRAMLEHADFYAPATIRGLVRSPVDFVVALEYHTGFRGVDLNPQWYLDGMGQVPYAPPNVAGWKNNGYWVNTSIMSARAEFARDVTWHLRANNANEVSKGRTPDQVIDLVAQMFGLTLSATTRTALTNYIAVQRANEPWIGWWESTNLLTMAMLAPEMHVA